MQISILQKSPTYFTRKTSNDSIKKRFKSIGWKLAKLEFPPTLKMQFREC